MAAIWAWLVANIGTIIICTVILAMVVFLITVLIRDKKKGKCSCGGSCGTCGMNCHNKKS